MKKPRFFRRLYDSVIQYSEHKLAPYYLAGLSFIESSFFPIPPDVMLVPMVLSKPYKAWEYAAITTIASILGGILGYLIGVYAFALLGEPIIHFFNARNAYLTVVEWFNQYGFLAVLLAGLTPIPYKLFTIAAGVTQMNFPAFVLASIFGRALRFFLVAALIKSVGKKLEPVILKYIDIIGWLSLLFCGALGYYLIN